MVLFPTKGKGKIMAKHSADVLAIAGITLHVAMMKHLESIGVLKDEDAAAIFRTALSGTAPEHKAAVTAILTDLAKG